MSKKGQSGMSGDSSEARTLMLQPTTSNDPSLSTEFLALPPAVEVKVKKSVASSLGLEVGGFVSITNTDSEGKSYVCVAEIAIDENMPTNLIAMTVPVKMSLHHPSQKVKVEAVRPESTPAGLEFRFNPPKELAEDVPAAIIKLLEFNISNKVLSLNTFVPVLYRGTTYYFQLKANGVASPLARFVPQSSTLMIVPTTSASVEDLANRLAGLQVGDEKPKTGFGRVGGLGPVLDELTALVRAPLEHPALYKAMGVKPPKGVLLFGPPGTGKTLLAKALAEELDCGFEFADAVSLVSRVPGETEERVARMFAKARETARDQGACILFVDEIDALCAKREEASSDAERRIVTAFLTNLDGIANKDGDEQGTVVLLGATNRPNALDEAVRRAGRLEAELEVGVPSRDGRKEILSILVRGVPCGLTPQQLDVIANKTHAFTGADLNRLVTTAAKEALAEALRKKPFRADARLVGQSDDEGDESGDEEETAEEKAARHERNQLRVLRKQLKEETASRELELPLVLMTHFERAMTEVKPSALKELAVEVPSVKWGDIGGYRETKSRLQEMVEWPIKYGNLFASVGVDAPKGVLLYGPPGCSKTMLARAVATESEMNFIAVKGPELFSKWVGESERAVRDLFRRARQSSPCVIFFDEVDALGVDRESGDAGGVGARVLSQMLNEMDGIGPAKQLVVIGATNRPDLLDAALMRPGRFDRLLLVPLPDRLARFEMVVNNLRKVPIDREAWGAVASEAPTDLPRKDRDDTGEYFASAQRSEDEVVIRAANWVAYRSAGYSGAELVNVCKEAAMDAMRDAINRGQVNGGVVISPCHVEASLKRVQPRIKPSLVEFYDKFEQQHSKA